MKTKTPIFVLIACLILVTVFVLLSLRRSAPSDHVRVGALVPLTGNNASYGQALRRGMDLAVSEINDQGGIDSQPLTIIYEDDQANPQLGAASFKKLTDVDQVPLVIGGMFSAVTLAVAPLAESKGVVLLSPTSSAVELTNAGDYIFRIYPSDTFDGRYAAQFAFNTLGASTAAILPLQVSSTTAISRVFEEEFKRLGGNVVLLERHMEGETDFRTQLGKLQSAKPAVVFLPSYKNEICRILRQAKELNVSAKFLTISTFNDPAVLQLGGSATEGVIFSTPFYNPASRDPLTSQFVARYRDRFGDEPNIWAAYGYDAVRVAHHAIAAVKRPIAPDKIKAALYGMKDFPGVTGNVTFDKNGDVEKELRMMVVRNGVFEPYK